MLRKLLVIAGLIIALPGGAVAHDYVIHYTHLVTIVAPQVAQDQNVVSASVRLGVLATANVMPGMPHTGVNQGVHVKPYWAGERTVELDRTDEGFFTKVRLSATEIPFGPRMGPVMAQLTLTLADESTLVLREEFVPVLRGHNLSNYDDFNRTLADELRTFNGTTSATESQTVSISIYRRGPDAW